MQKKCFKLAFLFLSEEKLSQEYKNIGTLSLVTNKCEGKLYVMCKLVFLGACEKRSLRSNTGKWWKANNERVT